MKLFVLREARNVQALMTFLDGWKAAADNCKPWAVEINEEKSKRSKIQNDRYWAILKEISDQAWIEGKQFSSEIWHEYLKRKFLGVDDLPITGTVAKSTQKLNTAQFSIYSQEVEAWAASELQVQFHTVGSE